MLCNKRIPKTLHDDDNDIILEMFVKHRIKAFFFKYKPFIKYKIQVSFT